MPPPPPPPRPRRSQGSDPQAIQAYYEKVFDSVSYVEHDKRDKALIKAVISREGRAEERIELRRPVKAAGNIEDWLNDLLREKRATMKLLAAACAAEVGAGAGAGAGAAGVDLQQLRAFVDGSCGQYALLGLQLLWTAETEAALAASRKDKRAMRAASERAKAVLSTLSAWCLQDLGTKMNRTKIETLVTVQVHMRDVTDELRDRRVAGTDDFEWLKQMRFYWQPDGADALDDAGACTVRVTDVPFSYQYEYLGCKERLVITPLTDRCYITLAQAMGMHYGGSPAGPAGTGKTETVKDMGRSIGVFVVVLNCTDQLRYNDCAKIFKGLCMAGLWGWCVRAGGRRRLRARARARARLPPPTRPSAPPAPLPRAASTSSTASRCLCCQWSRSKCLPCCRRKRPTRRCSTSPATPCRWR